jgi:hypothetical protein
VLFESIIISQLSDANTRNRALERHEQGTFLDDLAEFADAVEREAQLRKLEKKLRSEQLAAEAEAATTEERIPKFDPDTGKWYDPETGEVIGTSRDDLTTPNEEV